MACYTSMNKSSAQRDPMTRVYRLFKRRAARSAACTGNDSKKRTAGVYAESGPFELGNGDRVMHAKQLITDTENVGSNGLRFRFKTRQTPAQTFSESQIYDLQTDGYTDIREQGRELSLRVESPYDQDFDIGRVKMQVSPVADDEGLPLPPEEYTQEYFAKMRDQLINEDSLKMRRDKITLSKLAACAFKALMGLGSKLRWTIVVHYQPVQ